MSIDTTHPAGRPSTQPTEADLAIALDRVHTNPVSRGRTRQRLALITEAARRSGSYVANAPYRAVAPADALAGLDAFRRPLQDSPIEPREVLAELDTFGSPATVVSTHGRYFGFVNGGIDPTAQAASILAGTWDQNAAMPVQSPVAATLDDVAGAWVVDALGLPSSAVASFCGGATVANLTAIIAARDALYAKQGWDVARDGLVGAPALRIILGAEAHASVYKSLRLAGFGTAQIEHVPTDETGAVRADAFPHDTSDDTLVILQAGNVNTGASDPFVDIIPGVRKRGGWVHVDGAFGLWAAASPKLRHLVEGSELADSWTTDAHKWLNVGYDSGIVIVRDVDALVRAMSIDAAYLATEGAPPSMNRGIQISQRARGIETWAMLASHGKEGLADLIERTCELATRFANNLADGGVEILCTPVLNQVLVSFGDDVTTNKVIDAVQLEGTMWAGASEWHGRRAMRLSVSDAATTTDDVDASAIALLRAWGAVTLR
ncbi:pyridoxal phosphate-dependent decarboxylase family protein [Demequina oxidasica]|uniref:pyridoxal phosphate-dependent decarboxylase family protein n=1 Tax=Demequina oxidasica TaxID=676199 RepID=UPI0009FD3286|nr:aminotransferase class V-fold PLP-dependent enzyme [Demequina oxidasica]